MEFSKESLLPAVTFKTSRSGGKGGQNVNKVASKAELNFDIDASEVFTAEQKERIRQKLSSKLNADKLVQVISEEERSQFLNKERCLEKLFYLLKNALHEPKKRKATKPKKSAIEQRLKQKQQQAMKKMGRRKGYFD
jgi:ribosome-associated protein